MPELPEVETVCIGLKSDLVGQRIAAVYKYRDSIRNQIPESFCKLATNATIKAVERLAKYILIKLDNDMSIIIHLGMSGRLAFNDNNYIKQKHDHIIFELNDNKKLIFNDPRRFGVVDIMPNNNISDAKYFTKMGPDPLTKDFSGRYLYKICQKRKAPIKNLLMNNNIVIGVGNIYASESLFRSGIHPNKQANLITLQQYNLLAETIKIVLKEAIAAGGSSLRDYVDHDGNMGYFQTKLAVYGRNQQPCFNCRNIITKIFQGGRSSFFCPKCQPLN